MNAYSDLTTIKSDGRLNIDSTDYDTPLMALLIAASRAIDLHCNRFFYVDSTTRYFDGAGSTLQLDDLLAVTTFKLDEDGDQTFEATLASTDYILYPLNELPKTRAKAAPNGDYGAFASSVLMGVEIAGNFGYGTGISATPYTAALYLAAALNATVATAAGKTITIGGEGVVAPGHTILVESEQMYVEEATSDASKELTVIRGVNGTTAAIHSAKQIYIYDYPTPIVEATIIQAMRWWKRKDSAFQDVVGIPELGMVVAYKGLDPDIKLIVDSYRKRGW